MRCIQFDAFGLNALTAAQRETESPGPRQVRVKIHAVSLNYRDLLMVKGLYNPRLSLPLIPCSDGAGTVMEVGAEVEDLEPGDRVCSLMLPTWLEGSPPEDVHQHTLGGPADGVLAEEIVAHEHAFHRFPEHFSFEEAACLPVAGLTAWNALREAFHIERRHVVVVQGTGGVSLFALQIAKAVGATVAITSSSDEKLERARSLGADVLVNYQRNSQWFRPIQQHCGGADLVVEVAGGNSMDQSLRLVRPGGGIALIGILGGVEQKLELTRILMKQARIQGILVGHRRMFGEFVRFLEEKPIKPVISKRFRSMEAAGKAFETMEAQQHFGKIVVHIDNKEHS